MAKAFETIKIYDTLEERFNLLKDHIEVFGPKDDVKRPALLLFHGCGGQRPFIHRYAEAAAAKGIRAFVVDSFGARGWGRAFNLSFICTGMVLQGYERAGDILACLWGLGQRPGVDADNFILAGFSHGGWSISDLMTMKLNRSGEARIQDPDPKLLDGVKGLFLVYPYLNFPARSASLNWTHTPKTVAVLAGRDHLTPLDHATRIFERLRGTGVDVDIVPLDATHAFDESPSSPLTPMQFDPAAFDESIKALETLVEEIKSAANTTPEAKPAKRAAKG